jgi:hypothetical protein
MYIPINNPQDGGVDISSFSTKKNTNQCLVNFQWSPTGKARGTSMFFGGIRRSIPSYAQGFGGLSSSHSSTAIGRGLLRRRIKVQSWSLFVNDAIGMKWSVCFLDQGA